ncbi:MAG: hypothetical protein OEQ53_19235, partial [Saprospiraceae bacterium]|nr:hypothetical protein [Saprospiraceae bacterium]
VGKIGTELSGGTGHILTSPDGVHWQWKGQVGKTGDNSTFFYNPFRKKWVFTIRAFGRAVPPWSPDTWNGSRRGRARSYWEHSDFEAAIGGWKEYEPVFWLGADRLDNKRVGYQFGREPQLYKIDAVGYESLMIGLLQLHYGPPNEICAESGFPKLTELHLAFSRDGFHWDRTNRATFIGATLDPKSWERAYIHSVGGVCSIFEDKIYFYYTAFQGNDKNHHQLQYWSGMYANASTGVAMLRRDGFASMDANHTGGTVITRKLKSNGRYLFVNVDAEDGELRAEICFEDGNPIPGYQLDQCVAIRKDTTKQMIHWQGDKDLEMITDQRFRIRFHLVSAKLYSFWVSQNIQGKSGGATAAGGPGLTGTWDK